MRQVFLTLLCTVLSLTVTAQREMIDHVVAMVGSEIVLLSEVEEQFSLMKSQNPTLAQRGGLRCDIMDQLLATKLLVNQARLDSIEVTEAELEEQLNARIERILGFMNGDLEQFEAYYGKTPTQVKEEFREDLENQLLAERMQAQIIANVAVTPSEVKSFYEQIPQDSLPYFGSEVEVREIVYHPPVNAEERQKAIDKLTTLREEILTGATTFEEAAQRFSDDGSARIGGDLGWAKRGKFVPAFEATAYQLEPGELSEVTETEFGFHLIQLIERRGNSIHVRHILVRPEITDNDLQLARHHLDSVRTLILDDSLTFSVAVKRHGNEDEQSYNNDGRMTNPATGNTFFDVAELDPDVYFAIDTLDVGGITAAFPFAGPTGETFYRIVELQSRTAPHRANLKQDYNRIMIATKESKENEFMSEWVEKRVSSTYLQIDGRFDGCPSLNKWREDAIRP
ncbi:MAG: peptidylprolyl isomerase [Bacteroidota bacterium]